MGLVPVLQIAHAHWREIIDHLRSVFPQEGCGLLAGSAGRSRAVLPVPNQLRSPDQFYMEPEKLLLALEAIDQKGWELMAIFHSHTYGPGIPSQQDIEGYFYPQTPALICYPLQFNKPDQGWGCRAYEIQNAAFNEIEMRILKSDSS